VQQKKLHVIVPMDFHSNMADVYTVLERFDKDPVFKEGGRAEFFKGISGTLFLETLMSAPRLIEVPRFTVAANGPESPLSRAGTSSVNCVLSAIDLAVELDVCVFPRMQPGHRARPA
jgi:hypothetical protein